MPALDTDIVTIVRQAAQRTLGGPYDGAMDHAEHVRLIRDGVVGGGPDWADLGSGRGAFTLALADLLGTTGRIVSVDRDAGALREQASELGRRFGDVSVGQRIADFSQPLALGPLDGIVMANSLHFIQDKAAVLALVHGYLRDGGRLILVEYDADQGNTWVPYPLSFDTWRTTAEAAGFSDTRRLTSVPSRFLDSIYSAVSIRLVGRACASLTLPGGHG
jgi:ubiquinone/menaquinone biosynthesis C-methylase UbiE